MRKTVALKDARIGRGVTEFSAEAFFVAREGAVEFQAGEHSEGRGGEIDPEAGPHVCGDRRGEGARRVEAHAGDGGFEGDE